MEEEKNILTEEMAFMCEDKETIRRGNVVINHFFDELEKEGFTVQQTKKYCFTN